MNYHNITHDDMNNGDGLRVVLWLAACDHKCYNCQNPQTWDSNSGILFDNNAEEEIFTELSKEYISGLTLSGGDPLHRNNLPEVFLLIKKMEERFPQKTIWLFTGYTWEEIENDKQKYEIVSSCDVIIDGEYIDKLRDITLKWRGSSNQRVIDVKKTLEENKIVLYCD